MSFLRRAGRLRLRYEARFRASDQAGKCVEFIGPPGAGKTTTMAALTPATRRRWLLREHLNMSGPVAIPEPIRAVYNKIFFDRLARHELSDNSITFTKYLLGIIDNDLKARYGTWRAGVMLDESLVQVCKSEILGLADADFRALAENRPLVLLIPRNPKSVVDQVRMRAEQAGGALREDDAVLEEQTVNHTLQARKIAERARAVGVPVLALSVEDGVERNAALVEAFLAAASRPEEPGGSTDHARRVRRQDA